MGESSGEMGMLGRIARVSPPFLSLYLMDSEKPLVDGNLSLL